MGLGFEGVGSGRKGLGCTRVNIYLTTPQEPLVMQHPTFAIPKWGPKRQTLNHAVDGVAIQVLH